MQMSDLEKRRLNFISSDDFYFLAYSILLVLELLGGSGKRIKDHRKIVFLIQFVADDRLLNILERSQERTVVNPVDRELLFTSFTTAELQKPEVFKILFSLEKRGYVVIERTAEAEVLDVRLVSDSLPQKFFETPRFDKEHRNATLLKQLVKLIPSLTFSTLIDKLYRNRGVRVWAF